MPATTTSADGSTYCSTMSQFIASSSRLRLQPQLYEPAPRQFWTASDPVTSGESRSKRGRGGIGKAAKECGARPARSSASRHVSLMPMSENPIFLDRQTRDKYRKQRQTYQPQTIIAQHIGKLLGSLLTPFVEVNRFWLELLRSSSLLRWIEQQTPTYCSPPAQLYKPGIPSELYWRVQM